ncbi:Sulfoxide reductase catalytic subunit YedY [bacterium HR40]|nr:Sulfoxide reductase catalytic subunit YedY [bacterium HR40]
MSREKREGGGLLLPRRQFVRTVAGSAAMLAGSLAGAGTARAANPDNLPPNEPEWAKALGPGVDATPYGMPVSYEAHVVRRWVPWLTASSESSVNFTPLQDLHGFVTPNGLCFERHHGGRAEIDPADHRLIIHGLVERPIMLTVDDLKRMPSESHFYFCECAANSGMEWRSAQLNSVQFTHGMVHCAQYTGVSLRTLLDYVGLKPNAKWVLAEGADAAAMTRSIPIEKALDDCMVAYGQNGEALRAEQGYPIRLVVPGFEANMWVKWLRRLEIGDQPWYTREETSKYTDLLPDGKARLFTWVMEAKSVVTFPCPEKPLNGPGYYTIRGLAWSGYGRIKRVDVSVDGGRNWQTAKLVEPVLPKCLTRFELPWRWNGEGALVVSRAIDETGYVQPTMYELQKVRGVESIYHNNGQQVWEVKPSGEVENVRLKYAS